MHGYALKTLLRGSNKALKSKAPIAGMDEIKKVQMYPFIEDLHTIHNSIVTNPPKGYTFIGLPSNNFFKFVKKTNKTKVFKSVLRFFYHMFLKVFNTTKIIDATHKSKVMEEADIILSGTPAVYETKKPWILYLFDNPACLAGNNYYLFIKNKPELEKQLSAESCKKIIAANKQHVDFMKNHFSKKIIDKTVVIPPAVEDHGMRNLKKKGKVKIVFMGSINIPLDFYAKGGLDVVKVFKRLSERKDVELVIRCMVPDEKLKEEIKGIPNVTLIDQKVPFEEILELYRSTDILFIPGHNYSVSSTIESMSFGIPVVALNTYAVEDFVINDYNGKVVEKSKLIKGYDHEAYPTYVRSDDFMNEAIKNNDPELIDRLTKALTELIENKKERERLSKNARKEFEKKYSISARNKEFKKVFDSVLKNERKA